MSAVFCDTFLRKTTVLLEGGRLVSVLIKCYDAQNKIISTFGGRK